MPQTVRLWSADSDGAIKEIPRARLNLEGRLEAWLERDITMLGDDLLVIGRQIPTDFGGYIDLLCVGPTGDLTIVELKRDRTPREITAQALDYASWVVDLTADRVDQVANDYLGDTGPLDVAFSRKFGHPVPEAVNERHSILIVGSVIDPSTERIVQYLSDTHGVRINVATFQYFKGAAGELIGRVFLMEPERVEYQAERRSGTGRKPALTPVELQALADENGVGELYARIVQEFRGHFERTRTTRSSLGFTGPFRGSDSVILSLLPGGSSVEEGVRFQLFDLRVEERFGLLRGAVRQYLPGSTKSWEYSAGAKEEWRGYDGHFRNIGDVLRLTDALRNGAEPRSVLGSNEMVDFES